MSVAPEQQAQSRPAERPAAPGPSSRQLGPNEFNTAMVHLYRGEVLRANTWRTRLDGTTNWAVLTTGATLSFAFSSTQGDTHVMILINSLLILYFLYIEARRYLFYDLWRTRVRVMEIEFFAEMLTPTNVINLDNWRQLLANDLTHPRFGISLWKAFGRRLRRNYIWIFAVLLLSWVVKITIHPTPAMSLGELYSRVNIGPLPAWLVLLAGAFVNGFILLAALSTRDRGPVDDETSSRHEMRQRMADTEAANLDDTLR